MVDPRPDFLLLRLQIGMYICSVGDQEDHLYCDSVETVICTPE